MSDFGRAAWLIWTANGLWLDDFGLEQTSKSATDAANNARRADARPFDPSPHVPGPFCPTRPQ